MEGLKSRKCHLISDHDAFVEPIVEKKIHGTRGGNKQYWSNATFSIRLLLNNKLLRNRWLFRIIIVLISAILFTRLPLQSSSHFSRRSPKTTQDGRTWASTLLRSPLKIRHIDAKDLMNHVGYQRRPQVVGVYNFSSVEELPTFLTRRPTQNKLQVPMSSFRDQNKLNDSDDYEEKASDPLEDDECKAQYNWMKTSFPTCNMLHEQDFTHLLIIKGKNEKEKKGLELLDSGYWRDVWRLQQDTDFVLKTMRYEHDMDERNYDRHRRDAVAMERLSWSPNIMNIYGYCANSGVFEYAPGGSIEDALWYQPDEPKWNSTERLVIAYQVATALEDAHNSERNGIPSLSHTDISTSQFVFVDGRYKLNDFNRCRFLPIRVNNDNNASKLCSFYVRSNPGNFRSPEEYRYEAETEKIDVYSMGNVFYALLTELWPFEDEDSKGVHKKIRDGHRPPIAQEFLDSKDPAHQALVNVIRKCWTQIPTQRSSAKAVADFLEEKLTNIGWPVGF